MLLLQLLEEKDTKSLPMHTLGVQKVIRVTQYIKTELEDPEIPEEYINYNIVFINTEIVPVELECWHKFRSINIVWNKFLWTISDMMPLENGDSCFFWITKCEIQSPQLMEDTLKILGL